MSEVRDRLRAAREYVERLDREATPGPWVARRINKRNNAAHSVCGVDDPERQQLALYVDEPNAELMVVSRALFPAIADILRTAIETADIERKWESLVYTENALALADAVLASVEGGE